MSLKICRFETDQGRFYGVVNGDYVNQLHGAPFSNVVETGESFPLQSVRLLAPCTPSKIICVGLNYRDHAAEFGNVLPDYPVLFMKAPSTVISTGDQIRYPVMAAQVDYEAEIALVIGRECRAVEESDAHAYIFGYTGANDVTARDLQRQNGQWTRAKSFDTFCPLGPYIVTGRPPAEIMVSSFVNGEVRQNSSSLQMVFGYSYLVSYISRIMTLLPGDVILTGTPGGVGSLAVSDQVSVVVGEAGTLENTVT